jgi:HEAT repeat protein
MKDMKKEIEALVSRLSGELQENAYKASDELAYIGTDEVVEHMLNLLHHQNPETRILAARTLGLIESNIRALIPLLDSVKDKENGDIAGDLLMALEGFDVSEFWVELFRLYLFGNYKVSMIAKELLDYKEFDINPRVLKKAQKHWEHFAHNTRHDDIFELRKAEVEAMFDDMRAFIEKSV